MKKIALITQSFNEGKNIPAFFEQTIEPFLTKNPGFEAWVFWFVDVSTDNSIEQLKKINHPRFKTMIAIERAGFRGGVLSLLKATYAAGMDGVFYVDCGNKFIPNEIVSFVDDNVMQHDLVLGFRSPRSDAMFRQFLTKVYGTLIDVMFGLRFGDYDTGCRYYSRKAMQFLLSTELNFVDMLPSEMSLQLISNQEMKIAQKNIAYVGRAGETSVAFNSRYKLIKVGMRAAVNMLRLRSTLSKAKKK